MKPKIKELEPVLVISQEELDGIVDLQEGEDGYFVETISEDDKGREVILHKDVVLVKTKGDELMYRVQRLHKELKENFFKYLQFLSEFLAAQKSKGTLEDKDLVDIGFYLRESENIADELRKEAKARKEMIGKHLAMIVMSETLNAKHVDGKVEGLYAVADPDLEISPALPKRGTKEYYDFMTWLGVKPEVIESAILDPHYVRTGAMLAERIAAGKPIPPGITLKNPIYSCVFRRKRKVNE